MTVLVSDSFNRANNTSSLGSTDSYAGGSTMTWAIITNGSAIWGINNNEAYTSKGANDSPAYLDMGANADNVKISVDLINPSSIYISGIAFRIQNTQNYFRAWATANTVHIERMLNGSVTTILSQSLSGLTAPITLSIGLSGSTITAYINGIQEAQVTDTNLQTATYHGMYVGNSTSIYLDNFKIESTTTSGTSVNVAATTAGTTNVAQAPSVSAGVDVSTVTAGMTSSAPAPTVTAETNINIISTVAGSASDAFAPSVSAQLQVTVSAVTANTTASAPAPSVGSIVNVSVSAMTASINNAANAPTIATQVQVNIFAVSASANAQEPSPAVEVQSQVTVSSVTAAANASMQAPYFGKLGEIIQQIQLSGQWNIQSSLSGQWNTQVTLKGQKNNYATLIGGLEGNNVASINNYNSQNFTMDIGCSENVDVTLYDQNGNALNLTGATVEWLLQYYVSDASPLVLKSTSDGSITITSETNGTLEFTLRPGDTKPNNAPLRGGGYYHEMKVTDASGDKARVLSGMATLNATASSI